MHQSVSFLTNMSNIIFAVMRIDKYIVKPGSTFYEKQRDSEAVFNRADSNRTGIHLQN